MSAFKIDTEKVDESVEKLKKLLDECKDLYNKKIPNSNVDKGTTHSELEELCQNIKTTCLYLGELINNSILFLGKSSEMFDTSDRESASAISDYVKEAVAVGATIIGATAKSSKGGTVPTSLAKGDTKVSQISEPVELDWYMQHVTDAEYALLCGFWGEVCNKKDPKKAFKNKLQSLPENDPLRNLDTKNVMIHEDKDSGYSALAILDDNSKSALVIFAPTNGFSDLGDIGTDALLTLGRSTKQSENAIFFVDQLSGMYDNIQVTGWSLGGYLATSATLKNSSVSRCVAFDPPGRWDTLYQNITNNGQTSKVVTYEARGSIVSDVGVGVGDIRRLNVDFNMDCGVPNHGIGQISDAIGKHYGANSGKDLIEKSWKLTCDVNL